ncbi:HPP family-domain-containing protein [Apodospora peruviana]|uniref:HPP family-domain-containing protein n=1 Tax=Apodospora peruviana TaxID=516989 RepID=A0AAE0HX80_9PEZI|nr:HPP family-domain-containing protein [Apodospora peruviana]
MPSLSSPLRWHLDIDSYLNPIVPPSILPRLPYPIAHFFGYRGTHRAIGALPGNIIVVFWAFVGIFGTLSIIGLIGKHVASFEIRAVPTIIGSFGAAAVLDFYAIESPLAQPRNAILGQLIASVVGVGICKLFALASPEDFESIRWLGAALSCAAATALMALTGTVHPPAGATALMAVLDDDVADLGWFLIAPVMLGCAVMLTMALLVNNVQRRFPFYWWTPEETGQYWRENLKFGHHRSDENDGAGGSGKLGRSTFAACTLSSGDLEMSRSATRSGEDDPSVVITRGVVHLHLPESFYLSPEEKKLLEGISLRI